MMPAVLETAIEAAREAGELLRRGRREGVSVEGKGVADITTDVDRASEAAIVARVTARFPGHDILGEEGARARRASPWRWVIDPLDGTKNFAHGGLRCAVSIAVEREGRAVAGVVYAPFVDELYVAAEGRGARCNDAPVRVSAVASLRAAMVATAVTYDGARADAAQLARLTRVFGAARALRALGCASLDLCDVARGRLDAYFEPGLAPWDTAAGALVVREAGGAVTAFDATPHTPAAPDVLASNGLVHAALLAEMLP